MSSIRKILRILPDEWYLQIQYYYKLKKFINFRNPKTFNEKLQWLKINDRKPEYTKLVDKLAVKEFITDTIGKEYIIPTLGVWTDVKDIDFDNLPDQFVLKANHDSGSVVVCRDKKKFDKEKAIEKLSRAMKRNFYWYGREWSYKDVKPCIFAEQYMEDDVKDDNLPEGLVDFKYFCFNGEPKFLYVSKGSEKHDTARLSFYDLDGKEMPFNRNDYSGPMGDYKFPANFHEMTCLAGKIASNIRSPFARVDLYSISNHIYFSEITLYPASGLLPFVPDEWDLKLGEMLKIK